LVKKAVLIIALLVPIMMSAQLLMFLNHPVQQGSVVVGFTNDVTYFYGDSITAGAIVAQQQNRFSSLLCAQFSLIESNLAVPGSQIVDSGESDVITANNAIFGTNISVWLAGYNDVRYYGTNAAALDDNMAALEFLTAWIALPTSQRVPWNAAGITYTGSWGNSSSTLGGLAYTTAASDSATFNFTGTTLLIGTARGGFGGNTIVVVDGTVTNIFSCLRTSADTGHGRNYSAGLIVFTNLSNSPHTAVFTAQSTGNTFLCWYAAYSAKQLPKVVLCGTLKVPSEGLTNGAPYTNASDFASDLYSGGISNVAATLSNAKLNVQWVPAPVMFELDWNQSDWVHPNESGHILIEQAIATAFAF
jgi:hypothetical protein